MTAKARLAARVLVLDPTGHVLLFRGFDPGRPDDGTWWLTPGGGLAPDESPADGARRELFEETGLHVDDLGSVIFERIVEFPFEGVHYRQRESFFCVRTDRFDPVNDAWTDIEVRSMLEHRWWTLGELETTSEQLYPEDLAQRLRPLL